MQKDKKNKIPLNEPNLIGNEWKYLKQCIDTNWISTAGSFVKSFERKLCKFTNSNYAIACINGTSALQISLKLAGVKSGDEVIVPTLTFIAPVNAINYNNARPIFMDVDDYCNIDIKKTCEFISKKTFFKNGFTFNKKTKKRISAILPVHVWGNAVNLEKLKLICKKKNIKIVEDASESLGTFYNEGSLKKRHTGTVGDLGCISFNGNKIITSGGGAVILTNNETLAEKAYYLINQAKNDPINFVHDEIGYNFKLTNVHAAIGLAQLENIKFFLKKKKIIYDHYKNTINFSNLFKISKKPYYANNNHWMNILEIKEFSNKRTVKKIFQKMKKANIDCRPIWKLIHTQKPYDKCQTYKIENAYKKINNSLCLPSSTSLNKSQLKEVVNLIKHFK